MSRFAAKECSAWLLTMTFTSKRLVENDVDVNNMTSSSGNLSENYIVVRMFLFDFYSTYGSDKGV